MPDLPTATSSLRRRCRHFLRSISDRIEEYQVEMSLVLLILGVFMAVIQLRLVVYTQAYQARNTVSQAMALLRETPEEQTTVEPRWERPSALERQQLAATLSADAVMVYDLAREQRIFAVDPQQRLYPGSLIKLMTAYTAVQEYALDETIAIDRESFTIGTVIEFQPGDELRVGDVLTALLINSGNDAALALADHHPGGYESFIRAMNRHAQLLGMDDTQFTNPSGLDESLQQTTVQDVTRLLAALLQEPAIRSRMGQQQAQVCTIENSRCYTVWHTHQLLPRDERVVLGKTGTTALAGEALVTVTSDDLAIILLRSEDRYGDTELLLQRFGPL